MVIIHCFLNNVVINVISNCGHVFRVGGIITSDWCVFECVNATEATSYVNKHLIGQTVIVPYMENTDSDILGLGITSSLMWISNRGHVFRVGGVRLHPTGVFSNVLMQKKRHESRTTSDLSKSDCSVHDRCRQRYHVYY